MVDTEKKLLRQYSSRFIEILGKHKIEGSSDISKPGDLLKQKDHKYPIYLLNRQEMPKDLRSNGGAYVTDANSGYNKSGVDEETGSEKRIHNAISLLSIAHAQNFELSLEEFISLLDHMEEALGCLLRSISTSADNVDTITSLKNEIRGTLISKLNDKVGTNIDAEEDNIDISLINSNLDFSGMLNALSKITESKSNGEKIKAYINVIFPRLLLKYIINVLNELEITFADWFKDVLKYPIFGDPTQNDKKKRLIEKEKYLKYFPDSSCNIEGQEDRAKIFLLSCDLDFWAQIINSLNSKMGGKYFDYKYKDFYKKQGTVSRDYLSAVTNELKMYRNEDAHNGDSEFSNNAVIRVLSILFIFATKANLRVEATLLEKRLYFERYSSLGAKGFSPKAYYQIDFSNYPISPAFNVSGWKNIVTLKTNIEDVVNIENLVGTKSKTCNEYITNLLFEFSNQKVDVVNKIVESYQDLAIMLPLHVLNSSFKEYMLSCYPFHPCCFLLLSKKIKTNPQEVFLLLKDAAIRAYNDPDNDNTMIMPYELNIDLEPISSALECKFAYGVIRDTSSMSLIPNPHGWKFFKRELFSPSSLSSVFCNGAEIAYESAKKLSIIVLLLGLKSFYLKSVDEDNQASDLEIWNSQLLPNREWIRFCAIQKGVNLPEIERAIEALPEFYFINYRDVVIETKDGNTHRDGFYDFFIPKFEVENVKEVFSIKNKLDELLPTHIQALNAINDEWKKKYQDFTSSFLDEHENMVDSDHYLNKLKELEDCCEENKLLNQQEAEYYHDFIAYLQARSHLKKILRGELQSI